jgi:hypothetical protein
MPGLIDLIAGVEAVNIPLQATAAGVITQTYNVTGWSWWALINAQWTINNVGGAVAVSPIVQVDIGNIVIWTTPGTADVAGGAANLCCVNLFGSRQTPTGGRQGWGMPFVPIIDEGRITYGGTGGDVASTLNIGMLTIVGRRFHNRKS